MGSSVMRLILAGLLLLMALPAQAQRLGDVLQAVDFGVRCDGATDARAAINAAIVKANANGGGTVVLPRGVCRIAVSAGYVMPKSNVTLAGQGMGITTILIDDSAGIGIGSAIENWLRA